MSSKTQVSKDVDAVWDMDEDALTELLGVSQMGTDAVEDSLHSFGMLATVAGESDGVKAKADLSDYLKHKGAAFFKKLWKRVRETVCHIYSEGLPVEGDKDLAKYLAGIVIAAGKLTNALAVLVITIAVKKGLDALCKG